MKENKKTIVTIAVVAIILILIVAIGSFLYINSIKDREVQKPKDRTVNEEGYIEYEADATDKKEEFVKKLPPRDDLTEEEIAELKKNSPAGHEFVAPPKYE